MAQNETMVFFFASLDNNGLQLRQEMVVIVTVLPRHELRNQYTNRQFDQDQQKLLKKNNFLVLSRKY